MKAKLCYVALLALLILPAGCAPTASAPPTQTAAPPPTPTAQPQATPTSVAPATIVSEMVSRLNAGDVEGSLAYFAEDAMGYIVGLPPTGMEVYAGKEQIRALWEDSVANHFQWETVIKGSERGLVYVAAKTWHDFTRQIGVAPLEWVDVYEVQNDKIVTYATTITAEALARLKPALAEAMGEDEGAPPSTDQPVSELAVTFAGGTCATDAPLALRTGEIQVTMDIQDQDNMLYALTMFNLEAGKDLPDLMASTVGSPPDWADMLLMEELGPGHRETYQFAVEEGPVYMVCWSQPPELAVGSAGPFMVVP